MTIPHITKEQIMAIQPEITNTTAVAECNRCNALIDARNRAQPVQTEPVVPHDTLRAEYAKQVAEGTTGFYEWEVLEGDAWKKRSSINIFYERLSYRCTPHSCMVSKDGEPAIRMLRADAHALQRSLGDTVKWLIGGCWYDNRTQLDFDAQNAIYTYRAKATIKKAAWTGSRDDVLALLKELGLLK